jgi:hypothetical protein
MKPNVRPTPTLASLIHSHLRTPEYIEWLSGIIKNKNPDGSLSIMYSIHGSTDIDEYELPHLDGHVSLPLFHWELC